MDNISLGGVTPTVNPQFDRLIRPKKRAAVKETYVGVAYFGWPAIIAGVTLVLSWDYLESLEFDQFDALYVADAPVTFVPNDGSGKSYTVNITALDGEYHLLLGSADGVYRKNVKLTLLIMAEIL